MIAWKRAREGTDGERDGYLVTWGHWQGGEEEEDGRPGVGSRSFSCARPYSRSPVMSGFCRERSNHHSPSEWPARHRTPRGISRKRRRILGMGCRTRPGCESAGKWGVDVQAKARAGQGRVNTRRDGTNRLWGLDSPECRKRNRA